jgi:hypothetical protein
MNDHLDRTVRTVLADIVATTPTAEPQPIHLVPLDHDVRGRRPVFAIAAALVVVAAIAAGLYVFSRQDGDGTAATSPSRLDGLLYPAAMSVTQLLFAPAAPDSRLGISVVSPSHHLFTISVMANFWGTLPADYNQRTVNGAVFGAGPTMGTMSYTALTSCAMVTIIDHSPNAAQWSTEATSLVNGTSIEAGGGSLHLPPGWTSLSGDWMANSYSADFTTPSGSKAILFQMEPSLGALLSQMSLMSATPTTFAGRPAWLLERSDNSWRFLGWERVEGGAALLGVDGATVEDLKNLASQLSAGHAAEWSHAEGESGTEVTTAATAAPTEGTAACGGFHFGVVPFGAG